VPERSFLALLLETGFDDPIVLARSRNARTTRAELVVADLRATRPLPPLQTSEI
jgi:hypothetical protein